MNGNHVWQWRAIAKDRSKRITAGLLSVLLWLLSLTWTPSAIALTQIKISDISYYECPPEVAEGAVTSGGSYMAANCFIVTGTADNPSGKTVYDADIYGRIYDANGDAILRNRTRVGSVESLPAGTSRFELRISVPANQPIPLRLEQFKAVGFSGKVRRAFITNEDPISEDE
jgi:hypothetical protein